MSHFDIAAQPVDSAECQHLQIEAADEVRRNAGQVHTLGIVAQVPLGKINGPAYLGRARITGHRGIDRERALCPLAAGLKNRIGESRIEFAAEFDI